jgi:hypothetical protein
VDIAGSQVDAFDLEADQLLGTQPGSGPDLPQDAVWPGQGEIGEFRRREWQFPGPGRERPSSVPIRSWAALAGLAAGCDRQAFRNA